ncbi:hypothetical protein DF268_35640 [Streptomyces sp. V2]|nr:hypothetical protein DF268_35640 [Streptomyces sp. V2]
MMCVSFVLLLSSLWLVCVCVYVWAGVIGVCCCGGGGGGGDGGGGGGGGGAGRCALPTGLSPGCFEGAPGATASSPGLVEGASGSAALSPGLVEEASGSTAFSPGFVEGASGSAASSPGSFEGSSFSPGSSWTEPNGPARTRPSGAPSDTVSSIVRTGCVNTRSAPCSRRSNRLSRRAPSANTPSAPSPSTLTQAGRASGRVRVTV